jgi:polysaccharide export outer membrane protein
MRLWASLLTLGLLTACASEPRRADLTAAEFLESGGLGHAATADQPGAYVIGATDLLNISVFQVPDLSVDEARVDASGSVQMPLIGSVQASGRTPDQLAEEVERGLEPYLQNPRVSVTVAEAASQKVTVDGAVAKPGVYVMRGQTTLLQAVAMAEGPTEVANLRSVAVFRNGEAGRMVAVFDLEAIRNGEAADPPLRGDDVVVVDTSRLSSALQKALRALPSFAVFGYL